jgi:hypothetical protein
VFYTSLHTILAFGILLGYSNRAVALEKEFNAATLFFGTSVFLSDLSWPLCTFGLTVCSGRSVVFLHCGTFHCIRTSSLTVLGDHRPEGFVDPQLETFSTIDFDNYMQKFGRESVLPHSYASV